MSLSKPEKLALDALIAEGKLVDAQNLLAGKTGTATVEAPSPAPPAPPPPPRAPQSIIADLLEQMCGLLGNKAQLVGLLDELRAVLNPPTPAAEK